MDRAMSYYEEVFPVSPDYRVWVQPEEGEERELRVGFAYQHQPGSFWYESQLESFARWNYEGKAFVRIRILNGEIRPRNAAIRPEKAQIDPQINPEEKELCFEIDSREICHRILSIEIDGKSRPLFLFTDPIQREAPLPDEAGVYRMKPSENDGEILSQTDLEECLSKADVLYFEKGVYNVLPFHLKRDNVSFYLEEGAALRLIWEAPGSARGEGERLLPSCSMSFTGKNIRIFGRGQIDGKAATDCFPKPLSCHGNFLNFEGCQDVLAEGILFTHSIGFCLVAASCQNVIFRSIKTAGSQDMTSNDGILLDGTKNGLVEQCFANNHDDSLEVKTHVYTQSSTEDILFRDCVVWNRGGMALAAAWENWYDIRRVTWRDISVIHHENYGNGVLCVYAGNRGRIEDLLFEDIDVEDSPFGGIAVTAEEHPWCIWGDPGAADFLGIRPEELSSAPNDNWPYIGNIRFKNIRIRHSEGFNSDFYPKPKLPGNGNGHGGRGYKLHVPTPEFSSGRVKVEKSHLTGPIVFENVWIETYRDQQNFPRFGRGEDHYAGRPIPGHYLTNLTEDNWILWEGVNPQLWELTPPRTAEETYSPIPDEKERMARIEFWESKVEFIAPKDKKV